MMNLNYNEIINVPILFRVKSKDYFEFLEQIQKLDFIDKVVVARLERLKDTKKYPKIYPTSRSQRIKKKIIMDKMQNYLIKLDGEEIQLSKLFKALKLSEIQYKTFQRYIVEMVINKLIVTRKEHSKGLKSFVRLK